MHVPHPSQAGLDKTPPLLRQASRSSQYTSYLVKTRVYYGTAEHSDTRSSFGFVSLLPPLPASEPLELPPCLLLSSESDPEPDSSPIILSDTLFTCSPLSLFTTAESCTLSGPLNLPKLSHPNSPYVPWETSLRRQILRPLSPAEERSSNPFSPDLPHKAVCIPESLEQSFATRQEGGPILARIRRHIKNVFHFKRSLKSDSSRCISHSSIARCDLYPIHHTSLDHQRMAHTPSFDSTYSNSLGMWLADCQRKNTELGLMPKYHPSLEFALDQRSSEV
ncbi:hypothetical protein AMATHDRAFT_44474 [Amanita thiersii Skay4041]|uniref:Uncharacterized protein n=1 Tax=Amanita thiersii Skay4041 TaxID=703135 RepID=A0A2A9P0M4_9AGAR|nr:hypothetical protein AMATHDRAFT_44474 [Amanita thiersii Skay4041]